MLDPQYMLNARVSQIDNCIFKNLKMKVDFLKLVKAKWVKKEKHSLQRKKYTPLNKIIELNVKIENSECYYSRHLTTMYCSTLYSVECTTYCMHCTIYIYVQYITIHKHFIYCRNMFHSNISYFI